MTESTQETCICMDVRTAANKLTQIYDRALEPSGLSATQFSQLHLVATLEQPTMRELAEASQLDRSTLGRNLRVLEKMGMVNIAAGRDARTRVVRITRKGRNAVHKAFPHWRRIQDQLIETLGMPGRLELRQLLNQMTADQT